LKPVQGVLTLEELVVEHPHLMASIQREFGDHVAAFRLAGRNLPEAVLPQLSNDLLEMLIRVPSDQSLSLFTFRHALGTLDSSIKAIEAHERAQAIPHLLKTLEWLRLTRFMDCVDLSLRDVLGVERRVGKLLAAHTVAPYVNGLSLRERDLLHAGKQSVQEKVLTTVIQGNPELQPFKQAVQSEIEALGKLAPERRVPEARNVADIVTSTSKWLEKLQEHSNP
jgi:hypothetical protein